jgi:DNA-binding MarR family transcriptional regulator
MTTPPLQAPRTARATAPAAAPAAGRPAPAAGDELATRLRVAVTRLHRRLRQESLAGLTPSQSSTLASVDRLGTPTLGALALEEQVQPPTMTRLVAGLEAAGLVARQADAGDGRVCRVRLTAEGRRTLERVRTLKHAFLTRRIAALDEAERARLGDLTVLLEHLVAGR